MKSNPIVEYAAHRGDGASFADERDAALYAKLLWKDNGNGLAIFVDKAPRVKYDRVRKVLASGGGEGARSGGSLTGGFAFGFSNCLGSASFHFGWCFEARVGLDG